MARFKMDITKSMLPKAPEGYLAIPDGNGFVRLVKKTKKHHEICPLGCDGPAEECPNYMAHMAQGAGGHEALQHAARRREAASGFRAASYHKKGRNTW